MQPKLKFRNYTPRDEKIEHEKVAPANPQKYEPPPPEEEPDEPAEEVSHRPACPPLPVSSISSPVSRAAALCEAEQDAKV